MVLRPASKDPSRRTGRIARTATGEIGDGMNARRRAMAVVATGLVLSLTVTTQAEAATVSRLLVGGLNLPLGGKVSPDGSGYVSEAGTEHADGGQRLGQASGWWRASRGVRSPGSTSAPAARVVYTASQLTGEDVTASTFKQLRPDGTIAPAGRPCVRTSCARTRTARRPTGSRTWRPAARRRCRSSSRVTRTAGCWTRTPTRSAALATAGSSGTRPATTCSGCRRPARSGPWRSSRPSRS